MKWLLWKDYRHNRLIVFAALALLLGPYLIGLGVIGIGRWIPNSEGVYWKPLWMEIVGGASMYSLFMAHPVFAYLNHNPRINNNL